MATSPLQPITSAVGITTSWSTVYTVPTDKQGAGIDAVVINNYTVAKQSYSVRLVQSGTATSLNEIISDADVRPFSNNLAPAMIGQALVKGGKIQVKASANDSLSITITATVVDS